MKPDVTYIKRLLDAMESVGAPVVHARDLEDAGLEVVANQLGVLSDDLAFHLPLLHDRGLVVGVGDPEQVCWEFTYVGTSRQYTLVDRPIRLTADGHDFAASLREPKVLNTIRDKLSESSMAVWLQVAGALAKKAAMEQLGLSD